MSKNRLDSKGIAEAYEILMLLDEENLEKIPENILETFKEKRDIDYEVNIEKLMDGEMLQDTKNILCAIYYKHLATDEERQVIDDYKESLKKEMEKVDQDIQVGMTQDFFGINKNDETHQNGEQERTEQNTLPQVIVSDNIFIRILNKIKSIFKKNK
ncbi:MAG: hypothetical protein IKL68_04825 [Clostridia bacterium]|nr:hypothetical protein [Clostridia bacterium]